MLMMGGRHTIDEASEGTELQVIMGKGVLYQEWFDTLDYRMLGSLEGAFFFLEAETIDLSPTFEGFC